MADAEARARRQDLEDLRAGRRTAAQINATNSIVPSNVVVTFPEDLTALELDWDEGE